MYIDIFHTQNTDAKILHNNFESRAPLLRPQVTQRQSGKSLYATQKRGGRARNKQQGSVPAHLADDVIIFLEDAEHFNMWMVFFSVCTHVDILSGIQEFVQRQKTTF